MRRSYRLALSAACALAVLVAAGLLASDALSRADVAREATVASAAREAAREATAASQRRVAALASDRERNDAADTSVAAPAALSESAPERPQRSRNAGAAEPIVLDDPQTGLGSAVAIRGHDPAAPRAIELWRLVGSRSARVAIGHSRSDGTLELPVLVLPAGEVVLVASPRGAGANAAAASEPVRASRDPSPPRLALRDETVDASGATASLSLQVEPAELGGEIVVVRTIAAPDGGAASQVEALRAPVVAAADGARAPLDLVIALAPGDTEVRVAQELEDGRRSPWRSLVLDLQPKENDDVVAIVETLQP